MTNFNDIWKANYVGWDYVANIGLPIFLLLIALFSIYWFVRETKKKRLDFKAMTTWFTLNLIYTGIIIYVLIVTCLQIAGVERAINIFDWFAHYAFGFSLEGGKEWVFIMVFAFMSYTLVTTLRNSLKIADMQAKLDVLNRRVSVLTGKVNKSTDYTKEIKKPDTKKTSTTNKKVNKKK